MADLSSLGADTLGVWRQQDAQRLMSTSAVQRRVAGREWQRPFRGVLADGGSDLSHEQWAMAAVLASGAPADASVVACMRTAARVWGLTLIDDEDPATGGADRFVHDVSTPRALRPAGRTPPPAERGFAKGAAFVLLATDESHRIERHRLTLSPKELVQRPSGLWVTSPVRTAMDCCGLLSFEAAVCLLDVGLRAKLFTPDELAGAVAPGRPGAATRTRAVTAADGRAESSAETLARLLLLPVIPDLEPQVEVRGRHGDVIARLDLAEKQVKLAVEADGRRGHAGEAMAAKDHARDRRTGALGWETERVTWFDLRRRQQATQARVLSSYQRLLARAA